MVNGSALPELVVETEISTRYEVDREFQALRCVEAAGLYEISLHFQNIEKEI